MNRNSKVKNTKTEKPPRNNGVMRSTRQREAVLSVLRGCVGHMDAYHVYLKASEKISRLSLSTVYRALAVLTEQGMVRQRVFDGIGRFYELAKPEEHHHLLCLECGGIVELKPVIGQEEEKLLKQAGIDLVAVEVTLKGYCPACRPGREGTRYESLPR